MHNRSYELHAPPEFIPHESPPLSMMGSGSAGGSGPSGKAANGGWVRSGNMNPNLYATKKTVAQGLLDVALLSVNATQLKTIIQRGDDHDFYTVMVVLVSVSIALQLLVGVVFLVLGFINVNKEKNQRLAEILNNLATAAVFAVTVLNILSASFDTRNSAEPYQRRNSQTEPLAPR